MKVRIGLGLGTQVPTDDAGELAELVDSLEDLGFDSLWLSERATGVAPDPLVALAVAAGRTRRLKLGTSVLVLPGRNPVLLAKQLASLDRLSDGRLLPAVGLGVAVASFLTGWLGFREGPADRPVPLSPPRASVTAGPGHVGVGVLVRY